ncbi:hypothetical protein GCM10028812_04000 [Ancylobacter sonchi]
MAENGRQRPVGESIRAAEKPMNGAGESSRLAPATTARSISSSRSARSAWCSATKDEAQAASMVMLGPDQSKA